MVNERKEGKPVEKPAKMTDKEIREAFRKWIEGEFQEGKKGDRSPRRIPRGLPKHNNWIIGRAA